MVAYDFARSYLRFRTDRVNHTPRLQIDAACTVQAPGQPPRHFALTAPCIGESMYVPEGLIQSPVYEFVMIAEHRTEYAVQKKGADAARDISEAHRFGEAMMTNSGVPATVQVLDVHWRNYRRLAPITTYAAFSDALLRDQPINGRTTYLAGDGQTTVTLEYPAKTVNVAHGREAWQVDAGPVLIPDLNDPHPLLAGRFRLAYLVFNRWDYAEITTRQPVEVARTASGAVATTHFAGVRALAVRNELFCALDDETA